jgi:hypothetical protein
MDALNDVGDRLVMPNCIFVPSRILIRSLKYGISAASFSDSLIYAGWYLRRAIETLARNNPVKPQSSFAVAAIANNETLLNHVKMPLSRKAADPP